MTQRERIARFERLGLGLFVHFGVFSVPEGGEWHQAASKESAAEYARYLDRFSPKKDWAEDIAAFSSGNFPNRKSAKMPGPVYAGSGVSRYNNRENHVTTLPPY